MPKLLARIFQSRPYRFVNHASNIRFAVGIIAAVISWGVSKTHGKPLELIMLYASITGAATMFLADQFVKLYQKISSGQEPELEQGKPNIIFSYCRQDDLDIQGSFEDEDVEIIGGLVASFYNDVSSPKDRVNEVVAHLAYFREPKPGQELRDSIWNTIHGLWDPGHEEACDFIMNGSGRLVLAIIIREEGHYRSETSIHAVGHHKRTNINPHGLETFPLKGSLPAIVKVNLRGSGFLRKFAFRLSKEKEQYNCEQLPTPD